MSKTASRTRVLNGGSPASAVASVFVCAAGALATVMGAAQPLRAQEYCVSCAGPAGLYRCVIDGARPGVTSSLQLLCVERMARDGGHASCSVKRGMTVFDCDAPVKRVAITDADAPPVNPVTAAPASSSVAVGTTVVPPVLQSAPAAGASSKDEPKTMLEVAKRAKDATDAEFKKAGEQMKSSAEKTNTGFKNAWRCVTTLFTRCGGE
jgi:hypothetical protein